MIYYTVYEKNQGEVDPRKCNHIFVSNKFTDARNFILNECGNRNVSMVEEDCSDGKLNSFSFVPALAYTIC